MQISQTWNNLKFILISALLAFTVFNILSVNVFESSVHDAKIQKAFKTAEETRLKASKGKDNSEINDMKPAVIEDHNGNVILKPKSKDIYSYSTILDRLLYYFPYNPDHEVENNLYQLWKFSKTDLPEQFPEDCESLVDRWREANTDHVYNLLSLEEAEDLVVDLLRPSVPEVIDALRLMPHPRLKFELLKLLLVYLNGGVYADIDTINIKPIKYWFKSAMVPTRLWLGIDADYNNPNWKDHYSRRLTFTNNIIRSKAYHPLLARVIARITFILFSQRSVVESINWETEFQDLDASGAPLIQFTGTSILTDTAFEYMNQLENPPYLTNLKNKNYGKENLVLQKATFGPEVDPEQRFSYKKFTILSSPVQVSDIAILPKVSFTGYDSAQIDAFDDDNEKKGYDKFYYGRSKDLTEWSPKKLRLDSN